MSSFRPFSRLTLVEGEYNSHRRFALVKGEIALAVESFLGAIVAELRDFPGKCHTTRITRQIPVTMPAETPVRRGAPVKLRA